MSFVTCCTVGSDVYSGFDDDELNQFAIIPFAAKAVIPSVSTAAAAIAKYFFLDFSIENRTNIRFDIDELRIKLNDKKISKATNAQMIELTPVLALEKAQSFKHGYRNVIVLKKMTFPNDKVLTIELSEKQISGRTISLALDYADVLYADSFNSCLMMEE